MVEYYAWDGHDVQAMRDHIRREFTSWFPLGVIERFPIVYVKPDPPRDLPKMPT